MQTAAAVTMVRDDIFFLRAWLRHYGELLGRENCYIVNHGRGEEVTAEAAGCNVIGIPGDPHRNFDVKRWGLLNGIVGGLRRYYKHIIVGDVDELVVVDPQAGISLADLLESTKENQVLTPVGLEVIHRIDLEEEEIADSILGPRMHVRPAPHYSKPCIVSAPVKIARGGHFTQFDALNAPDDLYLFHLKFCDFGAYVGVMDHRNAVTGSLGGDVKKVAIGRHWFSEARGEDKAVFDAFQTLEMQEEFDFTRTRRRMRRSFGPRGDTGYYHFDRPEHQIQYRLPDRFIGAI